MNQRDSETPVNRETVKRLSNLRAAPRCCARTRAGTPCRCPAIRGRNAAVYTVGAVRALRKAPRMGTTPMGTTPPKLSPSAAGQEPLSGPSQRTNPIADNTPVGPRASPDRDPSGYDCGASTPTSRNLTHPPATPMNGGPGLRQR
jgi:hypothetical protein